MRCERCERVSFPRRREVERKSAEVATCKCAPILVFAVRPRLGLAVPPPQLSVSARPRHHYNFAVRRLLTTRLMESSSKVSME